MVKCLICIESHFLTVILIVSSTAVITCKVSEVGFVLLSSVAYYQCPVIIWLEVTGNVYKNLEYNINFIEMQFFMTKITEYCSTSVLL